MPTFDDTWLFPNTTIPPISTGTEPQPSHLESSPSSSKKCCLCGDGFAVDESHTQTFTQPPCDNLSCPECTWMLRNQDSTCQGCAARFTCPSRESASPSSLELDALPIIPSRRIEVPDDGYDGDDERGAISNFKAFPVEHVRHHYPAKSNTKGDFARPRFEVSGTRPQGPQGILARKVATEPFSGQQERRCRKKRVRRRRSRANGTGGSAQ